MNNSTLGIKQIFAKRVKEARLNKGISQEKFAEMLGIGVSTLSKIECAKSYPTPETMDKIISVLQIEPYLLFMNKGNIEAEKLYKSLTQKIKEYKEDELKLKIIHDFIMQLK